MSRQAVARDRTKTEHVATLREVRFPRPSQPQDGGWVILDLADGYAACGPARPDQFAPGIQYRFMGRWENNPRFGDQFRFGSFTVHGFAGQAGVVNYLAKTCEGIGEKLAARLWSKYGTEAVEVLRTDPARVAGDGLLSEAVARAAAEELEREKHLERTRIDLHDLLHGRGFHGKLIFQAIQKWGARAPAIIRRDPFRLLGMAGAGFKRCDKLWAELGLPLARLKRQLYACLNEIGHDRDGHTWLTANRAAECVIAAVGADGAKPKRTFQLGIRAGNLAVRRDAEGVVWLTTRPRAEAERRIADGVKRLTVAADEAGGACWPTDVPVSQGEGDGFPSRHQARELAHALVSAVGIFCGGPGTGKTHTLAFVLRQLVRRHGVQKVAVAAPTGKAAVRATQALKAAGLPIRATTIHQLLEIGRNGHDGGGWGFLRNRDNPLDERFLVIDESSMIDTSLMADVLDACAGGLFLPAQEERRIPAGGIIPARCRRCGRVLTTDESREIGYGPECAKRVSPADFCPVEDQPAHKEVIIPAMPEIRSPGAHVLFVGDPYQLPPVGHGAPLRDLIAAGVPVGELTEVRRNAGRIVVACQDIKAGRPVEFSPRVDLDAEFPENLRLLECGPAETADVVCRLLAQGVKGFDPTWDTQVIVALNEKGACSRTDLNDRLQKLLNPDGYAHPKCRYRVGDKVICLRNSFLRVCTLRGFQDEDARESGNYDDLGKDAEVYCANGELGRVVAVGEKSFVVRMGECEHPLRVGLGKRAAEDDAEGGEGKGGAAADFDLGYAVTGHKMQGSQAPCVVIVADEAATGVAAREWWYTSLSRASKLCVVVGPGATVRKQAAKQTLIRRKTFLAELVRESRQQEVQPNG